MILATLGTSMVKVLVVTRCHAQYGAVHNHRDLCDTPLGVPRMEYCARGLSDRTHSDL
jgi:hypothetical protein